jgi:twinkle protein
MTDKDKILDAKIRLGVQAAEIIARGLDIKKWSSVHLKGCCPFHDDKNPSFSWDREHYRFKCFGCGKTYDILDYYVEREGMEFGEAATKLMDMAGVLYDTKFKDRVSSEKSKPVEKKVETEMDEVDKAKYVKPNVKLNELTPEAIAYMEKRKISKATLDKWQVKMRGKNEYAFQFFGENNELTFLKYRPVGKGDEAKKNITREKETMPILYGMNMVNTTQPVVIVEGEFDALACFEAGVRNVVSVPSGSTDTTWIKICWKWLKRVPEFILFGDNDNAGRKMITELVIRLGEGKCRIAEHDYKDANEVLYYQGKDAVLKAVAEAKIVSKIGIIDVSCIQVPDEQESHGIPTGFIGLDRMMEDSQLGEVTIWTGRNGEGKSTILGQVILQAIEYGSSVFAYSGELTKERFFQWICTQAAGKEYLRPYKNKYGDEKYSVDPDAVAKIRKWIRGKLYLYDNSMRGSNIENTGLFDLCKYAAQRYGCKIFVIDNLMTSDFGAKDESNYYHAQSEFVGKLVSFAKTFNVHVHLVAHPKKTGERGITKEDISGSNDISNRADNVIAIQRKYEEDREYDAELSLLKNRNTGILGKVNLGFSQEDKRFYQIRSDGKYITKSYNWKDAEDYFAPTDEPSPF